MKIDEFDVLNLKKKFTPIKCLGCQTDPFFGHETGIKLFFLLSFIECDTDSCCIRNTHECSQRSFKNSKINTKEISC